MRRKFVVIPLTILLLYAVLRLTTFHYLYYKEVGISYNIFNGEVVLLNKGGWNVLPPWKLVSKIDTKPIRVCITSAGRGFNCKLVQFQPGSYRQFVETEGFRLYWWANRFSFNWGYDEEYRGIKDILRGYTFSAKKYPFVVVVEEYSQ